jgi:hypothetical protein
MHSNNDNNSSEGHDNEENPLEPCFTIFEVEPHVNHISHQIRLTGKFFTKTRTERGICGSGISTEGGGKCDEEKICNGIVSAKSDTGGNVLDDTNKTNKRCGRIQSKVA